jgi:hypothetical protein
MFCNGNITMKSVGIVDELHIIVNYINIMTDTQQGYFKLTSPATMQIIYISFSKELNTKLENKTNKCL